MCYNLHIMTTDEYLKQYDAATRKVMALAAQIDARVRDEYLLEYRLQDITYVLRSKFRDAAFRKRYVGNLPFNGFVPYPKGFCALSTICIYNLYGGDSIWRPSAIKLGVGCAVRCNQRPICAAARSVRDWRTH